MPPSTTCSHTWSAAFSPVWGRAASEFSILTASAGPVGSVGASTPVSGQRTGGGSGVGEGVGVDVLVVVGAAAVREDEPHAAALSTDATSSAAPSRRCSLGTWCLLAALGGRLRIRRRHDDSRP